MANIEKPRRRVIQRILEGRGESSPMDRRGAFDDEGLTEPIRTLINRVALHSWRVTDNDIGAVRATGLSEDQIFELVVCGAVGQANRQYEAAMAALDAAVNGSDRAPRDSR